MNNLMRVDDAIRMRNLRPCILETNALDEFVKTKQGKKNIYCGITMDGQKFPVTKYEVLRMHKGDCWFLNVSRVANAYDVFHYGCECSEEDSKQYSLKVSHKNDDYIIRYFKLNNGFSNVKVQLTSVDERDEGTSFGWKAYAVETRNSVQLFSYTYPFCYYNKQKGTIKLRNIGNGKEGDEAFSRTSLKHLRSFLEFVAYNHQWHPFFGLNTKVVRLLPFYEEIPLSEIERISNEEWNKELKRRNNAA